MSSKFEKKYVDIICVENLLLAWQEFARGKRHKPDVQLFARNLMTNIHDLYSDLATQVYQHGGYYSFKISDPKPRDIHKASVRDRLLHHAIYRQLYPFFDPIFIADSYSCRLGKGTQKAGERFRKMANQVSRNNTRTCWVLKGDIRKFFASIDQAIQAKRQQIQNLIAMRSSGLIDDAQFRDSKMKFEAELQSLEKALAKNQNTYKRLELIKEKFEFVVNCPPMFTEDNPKTQRMAAKKLCSSYQLSNGELKYELQPWYQPFQNYHDQIMERLEPMKDLDNKRKSEAFASLIPILGG